MRVKIKDFSIYIDESVIIVGILSMIFKEVRRYFENYFVCYLFIIFHELSHMFVASIFGIKTIKLSVRISGLCINLNENKRQGLKWLIIYLAGPISNIILANIFKNVPMIYTINIALAIINLIPISPLDGYNILSVILKVMRTKCKEKVLKLTQLFVMILFGIIGVYQLLFFKNLSIILMTFYIFIQGAITSKKYNSSLYQKCYKNITNFNSNY